MRVAITGASGLVGRRVVGLLSPRFEFTVLGRTSGFDLARSDNARWSEAIRGCDALLHLAARTDVDAIERERGLGERGEAWAVNVEATRRLGRVVDEAGLPMVLISTDFVFPAALRGPYAPIPAPTVGAQETSWYGWTKLMAEREVLRNARSSIVRISFPYVAFHPRRMDHARRILELNASGNLYALYEDQFFTPSFVDDVAATLGIVLDRKMTGIHHCASTDRLTPFDFAARLFRILGLDAGRLERGRFPDPVPPGKALRAKEGGLDTRRAKDDGLVVRPVDASLAEFCRQLGPRTHGEP